MYGSSRQSGRLAGLSASSSFSRTPVAGTSQSFQSSSASVTASQLSSQLNQMQMDEVSSDGDGEGEGEEAYEYGDMHMLVLQGVMAAGYLDANGVKKLFQESCKQLNCTVPVEEHVNMTYIQKVVRAINEKIQTYDMMIRSATCEITGKKFYVFLVRIEKQVMKLQTYFTKTELDFFQKMIDAIIRKYKHFSIPMIECINMGGELDPKVFTKMNAEEFILRMISMQYLVKVYTTPAKDEFEITLGFRTIRELEPIFCETYQDVFTNCVLCKHILLNGLQCPKCNTIVHRACRKKYLTKCKHCVTCKSPWKNEKAFLIRTRGTGEVPSPSSSQPTTRASQEPSSSTQAKKARLANQGEEVDMPILEPMVTPRGSSPSKISPSPKKKKEIASAPASRKTSQRKKTRAVRLSSTSDSD